MRPIHIIRGDLLYSQSTDLNINILWKKNAPEKYPNFQNNVRPNTQAQWPSPLDSWSSLSQQFDRLLREFNSHAHFGSGREIGGAHTFWLILGTDPRETGPTLRSVHSCLVQSWKPVPTHLEQTTLWYIHIIELYRTMEMNEPQLCATIWTDHKGALCLYVRKPRGFRTHTEWFHLYKLPKWAKLPVLYKSSDRRQAYKEK